MADRLILVVTLRKDVPDAATGETLLQTVRDRMADYPSVTVTGKTVVHHNALPDPPV